MGIWPGSHTHPGPCIWHSREVNKRGPACSFGSRPTVSVATPAFNLSHDSFLWKPASTLQQVPKGWHLLLPTSQMCHENSHVVVLCLKYNIGNNSRCLPSTWWEVITILTPPEIPKGSTPLFKGSFIPGNPWTSATSKKEAPRPRCHHSS